MGDACTRRGHFAVRFPPAGGLTRRLRRGSKACRPMGRSFSSGGPKGAVNGKPTARLRAHNHAEGLTRRLRRGRWGCRPEGGSTFFRSERKYQRKHAARRLQRRPAPLRVAGFGLREPLRGCPRPRFAALTRRKKASIAHFAGGARNVARNLVGQITPTLMRAPVLAFFRRQNGRAFFPSLPIAALLRRRLGGRRN